MQLQRQFSGQLIAIDTKTAIASGGEGRIYPIAQDSSLVAKIYHKPTDEDGDKLTVMFSMPPDAPIAEPGTLPLLGRSICCILSAGEKKSLVL